ncbi:MAG TPA: SRPBCC family protein, partial [Chloroflexota bacterium]|nr:SRPBCC family protein [Chloroflexota bacterium]
MATERFGALGNGQDQSSAKSSVWSDGRRNRSPRDAGNRKVNVALAGLSLGLGVGALLRPRKIAELMGIRSSDHVTNAAIRAVGIREITCGMGMLCQPRWSGWPRVRLLGDAIDLALLASALPLHRVQHRKRYSCAAATIAAVSALDAVATYAVEKQSASASRHGQDLAHVRAAITVNRSPDDAYKLWRNFENFPRFMANVESVRAVDER